MTRSPEQHSADSRQAAHTMWAGVADRNERLRNAQDNSPSGEKWHARRLFGQDVDLESLTPHQWKQVADARLAWLKANALKAARASRLKHARELRARADAIEAEVGAGGDVA